MIKITTSLILLCLALIITACTTTPPLTGSIKNKTYTPLSSRYSVPVPVLKSLGGITHDDPYGVSFTDDFSKLFRIEVLPIPEAEMDTIKHVERRQYLESILNEMYLPNTILRVFPASIVTYQNWYPNLGNGSLYAEVAMSEGSVGVASINGTPPKRMDAERGILLFIGGNDLCVVSTSLSMIRKSGESTPDRIKRMRPILERNTVDFMHTIEFTN